MSPQDERDAFWTAVHTIDDRVTDLKARFEERDEMTLDKIERAVRAAMPSPMMTEDEHRWVKQAIQAQAERAALRRAVIEKSLLGLIWACIVGAGIIVREYAIAHGVWKP